MEKKNFAITICRVSTAEQKLNNSLTRQEVSVSRMAEEINAEIVHTWSGDVSSKVGSNVVRKDLLEALDYCKRNKRVTHFIVDEVDRFMRSVEETFYWRVRFKSEAGVKMLVASNPELNKEDAKSRLLLALEGFKAEGSNEERITKSIKGHEQAIREGRYTFPPKPGYAKSPKPGIHACHPVTFKILQDSFKSIASGIETPLSALKKLNESIFTQHHAPWKMDKFSKFACDPYYCGILEIDKQVKVRNENGLHEPMMTKKEHERLVAVFKGKVKPRGPKMQYNPEFPMNKILSCEGCGNGTKFTGSIKNNGYARKTTSYYYKYHCRGCGKSFHRLDVHQAIDNVFNKVVYDGWQREDFLKALRTVWDRKQKGKVKDLDNLKKRREGLEVTKSDLLRELVRADSDLKDDFKEELDKVKVEIGELETKIKNASDLDGKFLKFAEFAFEYADSLSEDWWELDHEDRVRCQLLLIPGGILIDSEKKVSPNNFTSLYTVIPKKKATNVAMNSLMVELVGTAPTSD